MKNASSSSSSHLNSKAVPNLNCMKASGSSGGGQIIINNLLGGGTAAALTSSISSGSNNGGQNNAFATAFGTFTTGNKCPSSNFLRTATTAFTTTTTAKSSAILTQCNSNKQITANKETPEAISRQKVRLVGTALSSTGKRQLNSAGANSLSNKTIQSSCGA